MKIDRYYLDNAFLMEREDGARYVLTKNLVPGATVYGEQLINYEGIELRYWNPYRSKLSAAILSGAEHLPSFRSKRLLYLGAASGTTASHVSDLMDLDGLVYCVEFSTRNARNLVKLCELRVNMIPIVSDARQPHVYGAFMEPVDIIYQDVSQPDQVEILKTNIEWFLKKSGYFLLALKTQSIDTTIPPEMVHQKVLGQLESSGYQVVESLNIHQYQAHHWFIIGKIRDE